MRILGIETSCDETAASVVEDGRIVLSNVLATSAQDLAKFGGVFPEVAARKQVECIVPVIGKAMQVSGFRFQDLDAIAVTKGPGLLTSLLVGVMAARTLASAWKKPLIGVHHTLGHLSSTWLYGGKNICGEVCPYPFTSELVCTRVPEDELQFPILSLSVSGGHTELWLRESHTSGTLLGRTLDDAAGEAFDKGAVLLGLPYPGGPALSKLAEGGDTHAVEFPSPLEDAETYHFSFAGLKTSLKYHLRDRGFDRIGPSWDKLTTSGGLVTLSEVEKRDIAASYQEAICRHLVSRVERALRIHSGVKEVHLVGGVSANTRLRTLLQELVRQLPTANCQLSIRWPSAIEFCTDNAAMIAGAATFMVQELSERAYAPFETEASPSSESSKHWQQRTKNDPEETNDCDGANKILPLHSFSER